MKEIGSLKRYLLSFLAVAGSAAMVWGDALLSPLPYLLQQVIRFVVFICLFMVLMQLVMRVNHLKQLDMQYGSINPGTGICKKSAFVELVEHEILRAGRVQSRYSVMSLAIQIPGTHASKMSQRDVFHHQKSMIAIVKASTRKTDVLGHLDGDAIAILMPETNETEMKMVAERIVRRQRQVGRLRGAAAIFIGGVTGSGSYSALDLIRAADEQLYLAMQETAAISLHHLPPVEKEVS